MRLLAGVLILLCLAMGADAQVGAPIGAQRGINNVPFPIGPNGLTGNASFVPPAGCANQLVLDYSNSCALIAQGWGQ